MRFAIAFKSGGDPAFRSAHQPIRVAGSVHAKTSTHRLVSILASVGPDRDLAEFAEAVMAIPPLPGVGSDVSADPVGDPLDFNGAGEARGEVAELFGQRVREGGTDGITRFEALSRIIGYWIRRCRQGHATPAQAWQEISDYNAARIYPPWPEDRLRHESEQLWRRDSAQQDQRQTAGTDASGEAPSGPARGGDDDDLLPVGLVRADRDLDDLAREFEPTAQSIRVTGARKFPRSGG